MSINKAKINSLVTQSKKWSKRNGRFLFGIFCIILGSLLIINSKKLIAHLILFLTGLGLVYYGLILINAKSATDYIDEKIKWLIKKLQQN